ncbi:MAG: polysaccharide pyruvyl transferase family protein, partial [Candidatus Gastranaerophilales bacterium]|nr:polysaccharide pyruvyl transferase family protein [Candidatus Gastranaerophilales bacterium]
NLNIDFNSKESKTTKWNYDSYFSLFLNNMCLRKSCGDCKFAKIPRQGDLTIGDFWGASPDLKDKMGTSLLISSNKKGEFLLDILKKNAKLFEQQPLEVAIKENPYLAKSSKPHIDRDKFFNALENHSVNDLKRYFLDDYCDCMVLNFWSALNYGAILTCYGVQCLLQELGKTTKVINYVSYPKELECNWEESFANKFANKYLNLTKPIKKYSDLLSLNQKANTFVVGSDQVFRKGCIKELVNDDFSWTMFFLDFVRSCNKKISYSASFGVDRVEGTLLELEKIYYYLAQFDDISVRENIATILLKNKFRLNSKMLVDGVFHIPKSKLIQMTSEYETQEEYIGCFVLPYFSNETWYQQKLQSLSSKLNLPIKTLEFNSETPVEKWLAFIKNAKILISDSYHAVVFSLIFNTPFVQIKNAKSQTRFETLFEVFGIKNKTVSEFNQELFDVAAEADFDWENINKIIEVETQKAKNWMKNALEKEKENKFISPHFLEAEIIGLKQKIRNLEELNQ